MGQVEREAGKRCLEVRDAHHDPELVADGRLAVEWKNTKEKQVESSTMPVSSHRSPDPSGFVQKSLGWILVKLLDHSRSVTYK